MSVIFFIREHILAAGYNSVNDFANQNHINGSTLKNFIDNNSASIPTLEAVLNALNSSNKYTRDGIVVTYESLKNSPEKLYFKKNDTSGFDEIKLSLDEREKKLDTINENLMMMAKELKLELKPLNEF